MFFILVLLSILFAFWLCTVIKITNQGRAEDSDSFWKRELDANYTRPTDAVPDYVHIPLHKLPFHETTDKELSEMQNKIKDLSQKEIINLTGLSNTDLKYKYGTARFNHLAACDQNFTILSRTLYKWGAYLNQKTNYSDAQIVLEYAVSCKVDISGVYTMLASIYEKQGYPSKIERLKEQVSTLDTLMKESIQESLSHYHSAN